MEITDYKKLFELNKKIFQQLKGDDSVADDSPEIDDLK